MCARFSLSASEKEINEAYAAELVEPYIRDNNISITDESLVITADQPGLIQKMHFQLVPWTAKSPKDTKFTFNARDDKIMVSNLWKSLFVKHKRVLVLADGFYEKDKLMHPEEDQNYGFKLNDRPVFAYAGLWSKWADKNPLIPPYYSFAIITTASNNIVGEIHDKQRMPVILNKNDEALWLSKDVAPEQLLQLLQPYPDELMHRFRVPKFTKKVSPKGGTDLIGSEGSQ